MKTKPLNNNVLIEVIREDDGVSRTDANESMKCGRLIEYSAITAHITASAGFNIANSITTEELSQYLANLVGKTVRWEEYAEGGQTFEEDGKTYALIPWWRLISYEEGE